MNSKVSRTIKIVNVKTIHWQCSGCDYLCAFLIDSRLSPETILECSITPMRCREIKRLGR